MVLKNKVKTVDTLRFKFESSILYTMSEIISIIPARGGSKGVPGKNVKKLDGIPLLAFSIKTSLESKIISRTIVSTDCEEIAKITIDGGQTVAI